jgi:hypothetical protein
MKPQGNLERLVNKYLGEEGVYSVRELCSVNAYIVTYFNANNNLCYIGFVDGEEAIIWIEENHYDNTNNHNYSTWNSKRQLLSTAYA